MKQNLTKLFAFLLCLIGATVPGMQALEIDHFANPTINSNAPDPSVMRAPDGMFYLSSGSAIWKSPNLTDWTWARWAFEGEGTQEPGDGHLGIKGDVWASDINYINGKYVMYFAISVWGGEWDCGICVATSDKPEGPYTWQKKLFNSREIGVQNSIDPFYIEDNGKKYLFWGSFSGIFGVELSDDGLSVVGEKKQIAGKGFPDGIEATCIYKRNGYYYLIGSRGSCCEGLNSTYNLCVARATSLFGTYTNKWGSHAMYNYYEPLLQSNDSVKGPGHCSEMIEDDHGQTWLYYHGYESSHPDDGRLGYLGKVDWVDDWPVMGTYPATGGVKPYIRRFESNDIRERWSYCDARGTRHKPGFDAGKVTSIAYRDGKLYCVYDHSSIKVLDAQSGQYLRDLPAGDVVRGGERVLSSVREYQGGIIACNMAVPGQELRIYYWSGDFAAPRLLMSTTDLKNCSRLGENMDVGSGWGDTWIAFANDNGSESALVEFHDNNGTWTSNRERITSNGSDNCRIGDNARAWMCGGTWWFGGNNMGAGYFGRGNGTINPNLWVPGLGNWGSEHKELFYGLHKYALNFVFDGKSNGRIRFLCDDSGNYNSTSSVGTWPASGLGGQENTTGECELCVNSDGKSYIEIWACSANQGLMYLTHNNPPEISTEPSVTANPARLDLNAHINDIAEGKITFSGRNLDNKELYLTLRDDNACVFTLSQNVLQPATGNNTVTVSYNTSKAGSHNASIEVRVDDVVRCTVPVSGKCTVYTPSYAIDKMEELWSYSVNKGNLGQTGWFDNNGITRDMCAVGTNLYVLNYNSSSITILDGKTGQTKGYLSVAGISGGKIALAAIKSLGDKVIGCNMAEANDELRVYIWDNDNATPRLLFSTTDHGGVEVGRSMATYGDMNNGIIALGYGQAPKNQNIQKVVYFTVENGNVNTTANVRDLSANYTGGNSSNQHVMFDSDMSFWLSNKDTYPMHFGNDGTLIEKVESGLDGQRFGVGNDLFTYAGHKYLAITTTLGSSSQAAWGNATLELLDISNGLGGATHRGRYPYDGLGPDNWGTVGNTAICHSISDLGNELYLWIMVPKQGIAAYYNSDGYRPNGAENISVDAADADAPAVYYNLQGVRMNAENLTPGLYIRRQGSVTTKVLVK